jgi:hypothetical protein
MVGGQVICDPLSGTQKPTESKAIRTGEDKRLQLTTTNTFLYPIATVHNELTSPEAHQNREVKHML